MSRNIFFYETAQSFAGIFKLQSKRLNRCSAWQFPSGHSVFLGLLQKHVVKYIHKPFKKRKKTFLKPAGHDRMWPFLTRAGRLTSVEQREDFINGALPICQQLYKAGRLFEAIPLDQACSSLLRTYTSPGLKCRVARVHTKLCLLRAGAGTQFASELIACFLKSLQDGAIQQHLLEQAESLASSTLDDLLATLA